MKKLPFITYAGVLVSGFIASLFFVGIGSSHGQKALDPLVFNPASFLCTDGRCETRVQATHVPFNHLALEWERDGHVFVRILEKEGWSEWVEVYGEPDGRDGDTEANIGFVDALRGTAYQLASAVPTQGTATPITLPAFSGERTLSGLKAMSHEGQDLITIIPRAQWLSGIDIGKEATEEKWLSAYHDIKKIIVHHTASVIKDTSGNGIIDGTDYRELARAIYSYHTYSQKWGDIGYQYIIDPEGAIYEGRIGGDGIVGGHAYRGRACSRFGTAANISFNDGTIGIALLGTYSEAQMTLQQKESLSALIARKAWEFEFEPLGYSTFQDSFYPNVLGHRDVDCTDCPGNGIEGGMAEIRQLSQQKFLAYSNTHSKQYRASPIATSTPAISMKKGEERMIEFQFTNTGTATWRRYGSSAVALLDDSLTQHLASLESVSLATVQNSAVSTTTPQTLRADLLEPNVRPGEIGTFRLTLRDAPDELVSEKSFVLTLGSRGWFGSAGKVTIQIENTGLEWAALRKDEVNGTLFAYKEKTQTLFVFENKGTKEWKKGDVVLAITDTQGKPSQFTKADAQIPFEEKTVKPGEKATFILKGSASQLGAFEYQLALLHGKDVLSGSTYTPLTGEVRYARAAELVYRLLPDTVLKLSTSSASMTLRNIGIEPWKEPMLVVFGKDGKSASGFKHSTWKSATIIDTDAQIDYGQLVNKEFILHAPKKSGTSRLQFGLRDGKIVIPIISSGKSASTIPATIKVTEPKKPVKVVVSKTTSKKK